MQTEAQQPTLEQIAANPAALANMSDDQLDALAAAGQESEDQSSNAGEKTRSDAPAAAIQPTPSAASDLQPKGVQAKDGQHIIPYSVLERERDRAARAEATAEALANQLEQMQQGNGQPAEGSGIANPGEISEEDLEQLEQDLPLVAKSIRAQMDLIQTLNKNLNAIQQEQQVAQQVKQQSVQDEVEAAIAANPHLSAWAEAANREENPDSTMWNRAADLDKVLREDPHWKEQSVADRLAKVAETVSSLYGAPVVKQPASAAPSQAATLQAKADAAIAAATKAGASAPRSLSDIPGGSAPPVDEVAALQAKSGPQLTAEFMRMTPEQIEAKLNQLR